MIKTLKKYGCVVAFVDQKLQVCQLKDDGSLDLWAGQINWKEVTKPISDEFLSDVNVALGLKLSLKDFENKNFDNEKI